MTGALGIAAAWAALSPAQQEALGAAAAAGEAGLTSATHPVEFGEGARLADHGYVAEATIGSLVLTEQGKALVAYGRTVQDSTTEELEDRG